jgi:hypothetical protein
MNQGKNWLRSEMELDEHTCGNGLTLSFGCANTRKLPLVHVDIVVIVNVGLRKKSAATPEYFRARYRVGPTIQAHLIVYLVIGFKNGNILYTHMNDVVPGVQHALKIHTPRIKPRVG